MDTAGHSSPATAVAVTTKADTTAPTTPRNFHRARRSGAYVTFAWSRSTDNVRVVQYLVYRVGRAAPVARTTRTSIRLSTFRGAVYYVRAVDAAGNRSHNSVRIRGR